MTYTIQSHAFLVYLLMTLALYYTASTKEILEYILNNELRNINDWCRANKLSLNPLKSNFLVILPRLRKPPL